jgi:hypothetical protein
MRRLSQMSVCEASARVSGVPESDLSRRKNCDFGANGNHPSPLPCFWEVLILHDFKSLFPEVLIPVDFKSFAPEVLILVGLNSCGMREIQKRTKISEVLILQDLQMKTGRSERALCLTFTSEYSANGTELSM